MLPRANGTAFASMAIRGGIAISTATAEAESPCPARIWGHAEPLLGVAGLVVDIADDLGGLGLVGLGDSQTGQVDVHLPRLEAEVRGRAAE